MPDVLVVPVVVLADIQLLVLLTLLERVLPAKVQAAEQVEALTAQVQQQNGVQAVAVVQMLPVVRPC
jgi:hypothetical protein